MAIVSKKRAEDAAKLEAERQLEAEINLARKQKGKQNRREWNKSTKEKNTSQSEVRSLLFVLFVQSRSNSLITIQFACIMLTVSYQVLFLPNKNQPVSKGSERAPIKGEKYLLVKINP